MKILHNTVEFAEIKTFKWRVDSNYLAIAKGINLQTHFESGKLNIDVAPVYWPAFTATRFAGQNIVDIYLWSPYCVTIVLQQSWPWVQLRWTREFEYEEGEDED